MSVLARYSAVASASAATGLTVSYSGGTLVTGPALGTALDSTYGHLLVVRRYAGSSVDPSIDTPSGWTKIVELTGTSGGFTEKLYAFTRRGDGSVNSVSLTATNAGDWRAQLLAVTGVNSDTFWATPTTVTSNSSVTSRAPAAQTTPYADMVAVGAVALSGTSGASTGFSWTNSFTKIAGTSSSSSLGVAYLEVASASTSVSTTASWTTSTLASAALILLGTDASAPPVAVVDTVSGMVRADARGSTSSPGPRTYSIAHTSGPDHSASIEEVADGYFVIPQDDTTTSTYTITVTDTGSALTSTSVVTVPPAAAVGAGGAEVLIRSGSVFV